MYLLLYCLVEFILILPPTLCCLLRVRAGTPAVVVLHSVLPVLNPISCNDYYDTEKLFQIYLCVNQFLS